MPAGLIGGGGGSFKSIQILLTGNSTSLNSTLNKSAHDIHNFETGVQKANKTMMSAGSVMKMGLAAGAVAAAAGLAYATAKAMQFDKAMRNVNSLAGLSEKAFQALEAQVIGMSKTLPQSATVLAEGLYDIESSGFKGAAAIKVLRASAEAASAGLTTTAVSARAIAATINAYGKSASDATDVSDTLFQTVNAGVITFDELASNLGDVLGSAAAAKVSIEEVGTAIATMTLAGIGGAESTTSLNNLITKTIQPSAALQKMFESLGVSSGEMALKTWGLKGTMDKLRVATGGNITTLMQLYPEIRAARGAFALMSNEGKNYTKVSAQIMDADARHGATLRVLKEQMKSAANQWQLFRNGIDASAIALGIKLIPMLVAAMKGIEAFAAAIGGSGKLGPMWDGLADTFKHVWEVLVSLGEAIAPILGLLGALALVPLIAMLNVLATVLAATTGFFADHKEILLAVAIAYTIANAAAIKVLAWRALSAVIVGLTNTLGMLAGGLGAVTAGLRAVTAAQVIAFAGLALVATVIAAAVLGWQAYNAIQSKVRKAVDESNKAIRSGSIEAMDKQTSALQKTRAELEKTVKSYTDASFISRFWKTFNGDAVGAIAAVNALDNVDAAIGKVNLSSQTAKENVVRYMQATMTPAAFAALTEDQVKLSAAMEAVASQAVDGGGKVTGSYADMTNGIKVFTAAHDPVINAEADLIAVMGDLAGATDNGTTAVDTLKNALDTLLNGPLNKEDALQAWQASLDGITEALKKNGKTLNVHTAAGRDNRKTLEDGVKALRDKIVADKEAGATGEELAATFKNGRKTLLDQAAAAGFNKKAVADLITEFGLTPDLVQTVIDAATDPAQAKILAVKLALAALHDKQVKVAIDYFTNGPPALPPGIAAPKKGQRHGGIMQFAMGGSRLPVSATMAKDGANLVQWAEPGTGGEAFIPLGQSNRGRSTDILGQVADMFGLSLSRFAVGGITKVDTHATGLAGAYATSVGKDVKGAGSSVASTTAAVAAVKKLSDAYQYNTSLIGLNAAQRKKAMSEHKADALSTSLDVRKSAAEEKAATAAVFATNKQSWDFDHLSTADQLANLDTKIGKEKQYSDKWMSFQSAKQSILSQQKAEADAAAAAAAAAAEAAAQAAAAHAQELTDNKQSWTFDHMTAQAQIANLTQRISLTEAYSSSWLSMSQQLEQLTTAATDATNQEKQAVEDLYATRVKDFQAMMGFDKASRGTSVSVDRLISNAAGQTSRFTEWSIDLTKVQGMGLGEGAMVGLGLTAGPTALEQLQRLLQSTPEQIQALNAAFAAQQSAAGTQVGMTKYASGGIEDHKAQVGTNLRLWGEPETGGEAYLPLGAGKRAGSVALMHDVARRFGYRMVGASSAPVTVVHSGGNTEQHYYNVSTTSNADPADIARSIAWRQRIRSKR